LKWLPGDIVVFYGRDRTSRLIELVTRGPSHVGIICHMEPFGRVIVESTTLCPHPCLIAKKNRDGVQVHTIEDRVANYPGKVMRLPLASRWALRAWESRQLTDECLEWVGLPYDLGGAVVSATRWLKWWPYPDLGSMFCSELIAALLQRFGRLPLGNPAVYSPASLIRALQRCTTYDKPEDIGPVLRLVSES
jgi:hypothetical protein